MAHSYRESLSTLNLTLERLLKIYDAMDDLVKEYFL
jgi:hypothetical protein